MTDERLRAALRKLDIAEFRGDQEEVIKKIIFGEGDAVISRPTAYGKTLLFIIPAILTGNTTVVITPLLALGRQMSQACNTKGIASIFFSKGMRDNTAESRRLSRLVNEGDEDVSLLFCTPEAYTGCNFLKACLRALGAAGKIDRVVIDECHCIADASAAFRQCYLSLNDAGTFGERRPPFLLLSATLRLQEIHGIVSMLRLRDLYIAILLNAVRLAEEANRDGKITIIFAASRKKAQKMCQQMRRKMSDVFRKEEVDFFIGDMTDAERCRKLLLWETHKIKVMCCTGAFGMGIDVRNVGCVIHCSLPLSMTKYVQEIGRGGREPNSPYKAVLMFNAADVTLNLKIISHDFSAESRGPLGVLEVFMYAVQNSGCRIKACMAPFVSDIATVPECRTRCDNCRPERPLNVVNLCWFGSVQQLMMAISCCTRFERDAAVSLTRLMDYCLGDRSATKYIEWSDGILMTKYGCLGGVGKYGFFMIMSIASLVNVVKFTRIATDLAVSLTTDRNGRLVDVDAVPRGAFFTTLSRHSPYIRFRDDEENFRKTIMIYVKNEILKFCVIRRYAYSEYLKVRNVVRSSQLAIHKPTDLRTLNDICPQADKLKYRALLVEILYKIKVLTERRNSPLTKYVDN